MLHAVYIVKNKLQYFITDISNSILERSGFQLPNHQIIPLSLIMDYRVFSSQQDHLMLVSRHEQRALNTQDTPCCTLTKSIHPSRVDQQEPHLSQKNRATIYITRTCHYSLNQRNLHTPRVFIKSVASDPVGILPRRQKITMTGPECWEKSSTIHLAISTHTPSVTDRFDIVVSVTPTVAVFKN